MDLYTNAGTLLLQMTLIGFGMGTLGVVPVVLIAESPLMSWTTKQLARAYARTQRDPNAPRGHRTQPRWF